jgi:hypothetical protein
MSDTKTNKKGFYTNPVHKFEGKWYFWIETWADRIGPFDSEKKAERELKKYIRQLDSQR